MDCILLIHTHEGEPIARFIQDNLRRLQVMVNVCDVTELESRNINFQLTLLLVTPEMITYMDAFGESFRPVLHFEMNRAFGILVDKSVNIEEETVKSVLENKLPEFDSCTLGRGRFVGSADISWREPNATSESLPS